MTTEDLFPGRQFTCIDCGWHVVVMSVPHANDEDLCAQCSWLREIKDPEEREKLRRHLNRNE